jgi:hypothetical protein
MADKDDKIFKKQSKNFKNRSNSGKTVFFSSLVVQIDKKIAPPSFKDGAVYFILENRAAAVSQAKLNEQRLLPHSAIAKMPGSCLPSRYSSMAPPPVETKLTFFPSLS